MSAILISWPCVRHSPSSAPLSSASSEAKRTRLGHAGRGSGHLPSRETAGASPFPDFVGRVSILGEFGTEFCKIRRKICASPTDDLKKPDAGDNRHPRSSAEADRSASFDARAVPGRFHVGRIPPLRLRPNSRLCTKISGHFCALRKDSVSLRG